VAEDTVRGMAELGSRTGSSTDEWADMDLLVLVRERHLYTESDDWIRQVGEHWIAVRHPGPFDDLPVRQVLFQGALDFDIVPLEAGTLRQRLNDPGVAFALGGGFGGGFRILLDKDGELASVDLDSTESRQGGEHLTRSQYEFVVNDFLFQVVWAAKHLRRGELWAAKDDVDCYMKANLVSLLEAEALTRGENDRVRTGGRYLEEWTTPDVLHRLPHIFPGYDTREVADALLAQLDLFGDVAGIVSTRKGFVYPHEAHRQIRSWAEQCLAPLRA
jgi:hypothetical protein